MFQLVYSTILFVTADFETQSSHQVKLKDKFELMKKKVENKYFKGRKLGSIDYPLPGNAITYSVQRLII